MECNDMRLNRIFGPS